MVCGSLLVCSSALGLVSWKSLIWFSASATFSLRWDSVQEKLVWAVLCFCFVWTPTPSPKHPSYPELPTLHMVLLEETPVLLLFSYSPTPIATRWPHSLCVSNTFSWFPCLNWKVNSLLIFYCLIPERVGDLSQLTLASSQAEPTLTRGERANSTKKVPGPKTVLITTPKNWPWKVLFLLKVPRRKMLEEWMDIVFREWPPLQIFYLQSKRKEVFICASLIRKKSERLHPCLEAKPNWTWWEKREAFSNTAEIPN